MEYDVSSHYRKRQKERGFPMFLRVERNLMRPLHSCHADLHDHPVDHEDPQKCNISIIFHLK